MANTQYATQERVVVETDERYAQSLAIQQPAQTARLHTCHCPADAPCRVSGKCTCAIGLLSKLEGETH